MYKILYPKNDSTIYELHPYRNAGIDQILELTKYAIGEQYDDVIDPLASWGETYNSRILIKFDLTDLQNEISAGTIHTASANYYLKLYSTEANSLQTDYTLYAYPLAQPWVNGNGNYNDDQEIQNGVSWYYRNKLGSGTWDSGSGSMLYMTNSGGGTWNANYAASQSFSYESPDIRMNITPIVKAWLSGSVTNNGLILKHSAEAEQDDKIYGSIKFFSKDTHTIYLPTLQVLWNSDNGYTGSFTTKTEASESFTIYCTNLKSKYTVGENIKLRLGVRDMYPEYTYVNSSESVTEKRLPSTSYYSIVDYVTGIDIVPFDTVGTKIQLDNRGHFITIDTENFLPVRYYKIMLKIIDDDGNEIILDNNFTFKIEK